jgi:peptidoglycan/LPS O-acetylase OafA/YrhL
MAKLRYRPDVDGLRAVAVAGVMLFHLGVPQIGGGFFGVDVFFVISGYLITSLLFVEFARGGASTL